MQREVDLVLRRLERRCWVLSITYGTLRERLPTGYALRQRQDLVRSLTITQLESLGDALLDFNGIADLELWFQANLSPN